MLKFNFKSMLDVESTFLTLQGFLNPGLLYNIRRCFRPFSDQLSSWLYSWGWVVLPRRGLSRQIKTVWAPHHILEPRPKLEQSSTLTEASLRCERDVHKDPNLQKKKENGDVWVPLYTKTYCIYEIHMSQKCTTQHICYIRHPYTREK